MNDEKLERFDTALSGLTGLNYDAALKSNLGDASIVKDVGPRIQAIARRCTTARDYIADVNRLQVIPLAEAITSFVQLIGALTGTDPAAFIQQRQSYISQVAERLDQIEVGLQPFELAENRRRIATLLGEDQEDVGRLRASLKDEANAILKQVKEEAESVLHEAHEKASAIQNTARKTATGVSVLQSGVKFAELTNTFKRGLLVSGVCASAAFVIFVIYIIVLAYHQPDLHNIPEAVYTSAIRVTLLGAIAAVVTFALKIFRSNLHMYYHTLHREQLTNSIESFVDAARTDEHRDAVLTKLIDAVSAFSASGLVDSSDDMPSAAKVIIDAIPRAAGKSE